jgi:hypothetical protein
MNNWRMNSMTKKKSKVAKKATTWKDVLKDARKRLPSERTKDRCDGCFNPRNTLTVKGNLEAVWTIEQVEIATELQGVYVPCSKCEKRRFLSLSKFSLDVLKSDLTEFKGFVLLKDDKYNALVGIDVSNLSVDLKEWTK